MFYILLFFFKISAADKDLSNRLGIGFEKISIKSSVNGIGVRYYPRKNIILNPSLGISTDKRNGIISLGLDVSKVLFFESNLNFFVGGGLNLVTTTNDSNDKSFDYELSGHIGVEFFFNNLENLGFVMKSGLVVSSVGEGGINFYTFGYTPIRAGIFFYF